MGWATVSIVGFLLSTALVIVLARSRTARWERERRVRRRPDPEAAARAFYEAARRRAQLVRGRRRPRGRPRAHGRDPARPERRTPEDRSTTGA